MMRSLRRATAAALLATALVAGSTGGATADPILPPLFPTPSPTPSPTPAPTPTPVPDPMYGAPEVGSCYRMSWDELHSEVHDEAPRDCEAIHTSRVYAVATLPPGATYDDWDAIGKAYAEECRPAYKALVSGSVREQLMSALGGAYFFPSQEQRGMGARWIRCDIVLYGGGRLAPLPDRLDVSGTPYALTRCLSPRRHLVTACSRPHAFRTFWAGLHRLDRYPGSEALARLTLRKCRKHARRPFGYQWPSREAWKDGRRGFYCLYKTRR